MRIGMIPLIIHTYYLANGLFDHTPLLIHFPSLPKPKGRFQFYDMWCKHKDFLKIIESILPTSNASHITSSCTTRNSQKGSHHHSAGASIGSSTRLLFAKAKQRKLASYIYAIKDANGYFVEGFEQLNPRRPISIDVIKEGPVLTTDQQVSMCKKFTDKDIRDAIFSIPSIKSVGLDGYSSAAEYETYLFFECNYAKELWKELNRWWQFLPAAQNNNDMVTTLLKNRGVKAKKYIAHAIFSAAIHLLWSARNQAVFHEHTISARQTVYLIKEQVRHRIDT
ncbi:hypothetical protein Cgig2_030230 [Carnegiea gigantea]|uniref:Uncharacterized protein n=1 Tax=Carnegiea gigantea TaxID=171969 RepID=A0A9Q1KHV3_9CARY|nr:hypothetical protein Cgig2_030230 [Carnegiea gigantea]